MTNPWIRKLFETAYAWPQLRLTLGMPHLNHCISISYHICYSRLAPCSSWTSTEPSSSVTLGTWAMEVELSTRTLFLYSGKMAGAPPSIVTYMLSSCAKHARHVHLQLLYYSSCISAWTAGRKLLRQLYKADHPCRSILWACACLLGHGMVLLKAVIVCPYWN